MAKNKITFGIVWLILAICLGIDASALTLKNACTHGVTIRYYSAVSPNVCPLKGGEVLLNQGQEVKVDLENSGKPKSCIGTDMTFSNISANVLPININIDETFLRNITFHCKMEQGDYHRTFCHCSGEEWSNGRLTKTWGAVTPPPPTPTYKFKFF